MTAQEWSNFVDASDRAKHYRGFYKHQHEGNIRKDVYYHRPRQRRIIAREYIQFAPVQISYGIMLKVCITFIVLMCIFTYNLGTFREIDFSTGQKIESTTEVVYDENYQFLEIIPPVLSRLKNCANSIEIYGRSESWLTIANNMTGSSAKNTIGIIANAICLPFNFIINTFTLGYNMYNSLTGKQTLITPTYKAPIDVLWFNPNWIQFVKTPFI